MISVLPNGLQRATTNVKRHEPEEGLSEIKDYRTFTNGISVSRVWETERLIFVNKIRLMSVSAKRVYFTPSRVAPQVIIPVPAVTSVRDGFFIFRSLCSLSQMQAVSRQ